MARYAKDEEKGGSLPQLGVDDISLSLYPGEDKLISNDTGYMATPHFIRSLTNVCELVLKAEKEKKEQTLIEGLNDINLRLPADVYIPLVRQSARNYKVLRIRVGEAKVFCTKTRAPFLCVLEVFRPEETQFKNVDDSHSFDLEAGRGSRGKTVAAPYPSLDEEINQFGDSKLSNAISVKKARGKFKYQDALNSDLLQPGSAFHSMFRETISQQWNVASLRDRINSAGETDKAEFDHPGQDDACAFYDDEL